MALDSNVQRTGASHAADIDLREKSGLQGTAESNLRADGQRRVAVLQALDDLGHIVGHQVFTLETQKGRPTVAQHTDTHFKFSRSER